MEKSLITAAKAIISAEYPDASRLQYHPGSDSISGYGWQLVSGQNGTFDRYGNGRYVLGTFEGNSIRTARGEDIPLEVIAKAAQS